MPKTKKSKAPSAADIEEFWSPLNENEVEQEEALEYIQEADSSLWITENPEAGGGLCKYITEFICCDVEPTPDLCAFLEELVEAKVPITDSCYKAVLEPDRFQQAMLIALLGSGYLPKEMHKKKPLDACFQCLEESAFAGTGQGTFEDFIKHHDPLKVRVTHAVGGPFAKWLNEEEQRTWLAGLEREVKPADDEEKKRDRDADKDADAGPESKQARTSTK